MIYEILDLKIDYKEYEGCKSDFQPRLHVMVPNDNDEAGKYMPTRPTVLIIPGGAYRMTSEREAEPVAMPYLFEGYNVFILRYSVAPATYPASLLEAGAAVKLIRENAEKWRVDTDKIFLLGFSAGGHLAASYGCFWNDGLFPRVLGGETDDYKVKGIILGYPVTSDDFEGEFKGTRNSFTNLLGDKTDDAELRKKLYLENSVTESFPPCFLFHTSEDKVVPALTTLRFASQLWLNKVPFELHVYEKGRHGRSIGTKVVCEEEYRLKGWVKESIDWMKERLAE